MKTSRNGPAFARAAFALFSGAALAAALMRPAPATAQTPAVQLPKYQTLAPVRVLGIIRRVFRSHRPPPPYEIYTMVRTEMTNYTADPGGPPYIDPTGSYTTQYWVRNLDRAALTRRVYRDESFGSLKFDRPALDEITDPGPPTADLFAPAPLVRHSNPQSYVPTPEPSNEPLKTIGSVVAIGEPDYRVPKMTVEGNLLHLILVPRRDPERNVLREIWVDKNSYELRKVISHDRLFTEDEGIFPVLFTYSLGYLNGQLVITHLHGLIQPRVDPNGTTTTFDEDASTIDFEFKDISFPSSLPDWYFNPRTYAQHQNDAPE